MCMVMRNCHEDTIHKKQLSHQRFQGGIHVGIFCYEMMGSKTMQTGYEKQIAMCLLRGCMNSFCDDCIMKKTV